MPGSCSAGANGANKNGVFEDVFDRDFILTNATIYWVTEHLPRSRLRVRP
jgi:hypothetical protein